MALTRIANIASTIPDDSIANVKMANIVQSKNILINGDMSVAQRSTSASSITSGGYHACDRWKEDMTSGGTWTISQSTTVPTGQGFATSLKMDCTTANGSLSANSELMVQQRLEGQNLQYLKKGTANAESTTLSFWVRSNKTGTYICELQDVDNTRQISKSYTISVADTWEKKTITFPGDTTGALDNNNARSLDCSFYLVAGSDLSSGTLSTTWTAKTDANRAVGQVNLADSTSNEWYITGVQLEAGDTASEFEFLPYGLNLERCLRYFYPIISISDTNNLNAFGYYYASGNIKIPIRLPTQMRTTPTLSQDVDTDALRFYRDATYDGLSGNFALDGNGTGRYLSIYNTTDASGTAGQAGQLYKYTPTQADSYIWLSAEL
jgi:hypothetical protein